MFGSSSSSVLNGFFLELSIVGVCRLFSYTVSGELIIICVLFIASLFYYFFAKVERLEILFSLYSFVICEKLKRLALFMFSGTKLEWQVLFIRELGC